MSAEPDSYRRTSSLLSRTATKEPRGPPSAVGEVELPHCRSQAARPQRDRELHGDAGRPHTPNGTHQAPVPKALRCARGRP